MGLAWGPAGRHGPTARAAIAATAGAGSGGGSLTKGRPGGDRRPLRLMHGEDLITRGPTFAYWERQSTDDIVDSLRPGEKEPLVVDEHGTVWQGNTRVFVLRWRGSDVDSLP